MKTSLKNCYLFVFLSLFLTVLCQSAYAVPMTTNYQGFLRDTLDKPLTANVNLSFTLYDASAGGTALWTESHTNIAVQDGVFGVILGSNQPIPENVLQKALYLGVKVNTDPEMQPRQAITSSLFAMRAGVAETVVKGAINSDSLTAGSVTMEKVADGAIGSSKLAASAVTGNNIAPNAVTGDKINNGTITNDKLSADVQQKLVQSGQMPSSVATLNVTDKIKVGTNSLYLNGSAQPAGTPDNSIHTDNGALFLQSKDTNTQNTVINANATNDGKVGIGTSDPKTKVEVKGVLKVSSNDYFDADTFGRGLLFAFHPPTHYTPNGQAEVSSFDLSGTKTYAPLILNGKNILINGKHTADGDIQPGNVGIGLSAGTDPKNKLDVAGSMAIGSSATPTWPWTGYAGYQTAPPNGLIVEGSVGIGTNTPKNKTDIAGSVAIGSGYAGTQTAPPNGLLVEGKVGIGITDTSWAKMEILATGNATALIVNNECLDWCYNTLIRVTSDNTKAIAVQKGKAHENGPTDAFVVMGNGDVYARKYLINSDARLKKDIQPLYGSSLEKVLKLQGVTYQLKDTPADQKTKEIGLIAQDVEKVVPEVVHTNHEGMKSVAYPNLVALLIESTKEQQAQLDQLKAQNDALKAIVCKDHPQEAICK